MLQKSIIGIMALFSLLHLASSHPGVFPDFYRISARDPAMAKDWPNGGSRYALVLRGHDTEAVKKCL